MKKLTKDEMKRVMGGVGDDDGDFFGCGTGISCTGKEEGDSCGTKTCVCETHSRGDKTLYCVTQI